MSCKNPTGSWLAVQGQSLLLSSLKLAGAVMPVKQQHCEACTRQKQAVEPTMEELKLQLPTESHCDDLPAVKAECWGGEYMYTGSLAC